MNALEVVQLTVNYEKAPVLWDLSLTVPAGKLVGIIGPNGAGKSTLIKAALGLIKPISGSVAFFGSPLKKVRNRVGYVPQRESVDWDFPITVFDLVMMGRYGHLGLFRRPKAADKELVWSYLAKVGLEKYASRQISQLSGGQQQRAFIARALIQEADLYFMDEPFVGIDMTSCELILDLLKSLREEGKTIFIVHHDLDSVPSIFDWAILLNMYLIGCGEIGDVFTPELIRRTYGKEEQLLDQVAKLSQEKTSGYPSL
ncbi:MAG: Fe(3+) dicitrate transport ATP-binding protein FecE [Chlamydiae bacterium]|nr:Fe(3+) dicitrate transport ATP-binding protein FecE [Chlamydiota bacterium]